MRRSVLLSLFFYIAAIAIPTGVHAATLYYNNAGGDGEWTNLNSWWTDAGFTIQASQLPTSADDVFIYSEVDSNNDDPASVNSADFSTFGLWDQNCNGLRLEVAQAAAFHDDSAFICGTLVGNATFDDRSFVQEGLITGDVIFNGSSHIGGNGTIVGHATFNDLSYDSGASIGNSSFNTPLSIAVGAFPFSAIAVGTRLYIANAHSSTVSAIDSLTDSVVATIPVGAFPVSGSLVGSNLYILNLGDDTVSVIDVDPRSGTYNSVIETISGASGPTYSAIVGTKVYIVGGHDVSVVDADPRSGTYNSVTANIAVGISPQFIVAVGPKVYVNNIINNMTTTTVSVIDSNTDSVITTLDTAWQGYSSYVVGTNIYMETLVPYVIDTKTDIATRAVNPPPRTNPLYSSSIGDKLYQVVNSKDRIVVTDTSVNAVVNVLAPHLLSFTSSSADGNYPAGQTVNITANFNKALNATSSMTVVLNTGATVALNAVSGSSLVGTYTVGAGEISPDLSVTSISSASVGDTALPIHVNSTPYHVPISPELTGDADGNLGDTSNIVIGSASYETVAVGSDPYQMTAVGSLLYVANQGSDTVSVVNTSTNAVSTSVNVGSQPYGVAYATSTKEIYVANLKGNTVSVIDADPASGTFNTVTHTISVGVEPYYVTILGNRAYITNHVSDTVSVINVSTHVVTNTIPVGRGPLALKTVGSKLYVANFGGSYDGSPQGTVSVINTGTNAVTATVVVGSGARGVAVSGTEVYVSNYVDGTVSVIDSSSDAVTHTIAVGNLPRGMLSLGSNVYAENYQDGTISVIDVSGHSVSATVKVGNTPAGIAAVGTDIYLSRFTDGKLSILDLTDNTLVEESASVSTPPAPSGGGGGGGGFVSQSTLAALLGIPTPKAVPGCPKGFVCTVIPTTAIKAPVITPFTFTVNLQLGSAGTSAKTLQQYLNAHGYKISASGAGSVGHETATFGLLTKTALIKFQKAHNIPATGFFGPITRAYILKHP